MKRSLLLLFGTSLFTSANLVAQPTLTASGCNMVAGDVFVNANANYMSPGSAGANQTWNLSSLSSTGSATLNVQNASASPYFSFYPTANLASQAPSGTWTFYKTSTTAFQFLGSHTTNGIKTTYSDPEDYMHYPFNYTNTYSDNFAGVTTNTASPMNTYRSGYNTVTADGYGTLITPAGTYNNVMRVHFVQDYQDSSNFGGTPFLYYYDNDQYMWYLNGTHTAIATVGSFTVNMGGSPTVQQFAQYITSGIGINENEGLRLSMDVFPNPACGQASLKYYLPHDAKVEIAVMNSLGQQILELAPEYMQAGSNESALDVRTLPEGIYFVHLMSEGRLEGVQKLMVVR